jgi:hypothetical protein
MKANVRLTNRQTKIARRKIDPNPTKLSLGHEKKRAPESAVVCDLGKRSAVTADPLSRGETYLKNCDFAYRLKDDRILQGDAGGVALLNELR